jgi:hypothetical protein
VSNAPGPSGASSFFKGVAASWPPTATPTAGWIYTLPDPVPAGTPAGFLAGYGAQWDGLAWVNIGPVRGPAGPAGPQGAAGAAGSPGVAGSNGTNGTNGTAATIAVGTVTTGSPGSSASVVNAGTSSAAVLNITIPRGDIGAAGSAGAAGPQGPAGPAGDAGPQGPAGVAGAAGATGPAGPPGTTEWSGLSGVPSPLTTGSNVANGYAALDSGGKIPVAHLPNSIMEYQGAWNAATNTPTLANGTGNAGDVYRVSVAGTALGLTFEIGDYAIYNGSTWEKSDSTDSAGAAPTFTATPVSAGTTILTSTSSVIQQFTGTTAGQHTCRLPTTGVVAGREFLIINSSTQSVSVRASDVTALGGVLTAGQSTRCIALIATPTNSSHWYRR